MAKGLEKSVITCDMEGRIETFGDGSEAMFGYSKEEIIGKKRVSLFSPGRVVLEHVPVWLEKASIEGEHTTRTVFLHKDGTPFAAEIRVTPTFKDGQQVGFCGVTEELEGVNPEEVAPKISTITNIFTWLVITRAPFLTAMIIPILIGAAWVAANGLASPFPWSNFFLALFGGIFLHVSANTFNDYFDWTSGTDPGNNDYFLPYTGGSRSIELRLINERSLLTVATISLLGSGALGFLLYQRVGVEVLYFGLAGAFFAYGNLGSLLPSLIDSIFTSVSQALEVFSFLQILTRVFLTLIEKMPLAWWGSIAVSLVLFPALWMVVYREFAAAKGVRK